MNSTEHNVIVAGSFRVVPSCMPIGEGVITYALTGASTALGEYRALP